MASAPTIESGPRVVAGRYRLERLIGEGAFAEVYRATDLTGGVDVAVKLLKDGPRADPEALERFRREVLAVAAIDSPHVVKLHDFGGVGDDVFIAMEYVEGAALRDLLGGQPLSPDSAHVVIGQIAQAVAAAHQKGIIHRDLKPENVVLVRGARGHQVKVLDFGLAKLVELEQSMGLLPLTQNGMCFGTPQYMSPEQMQGRVAERANDLWALAVMAYEVVAGRLPWDGDDMREVFYQVLGKPLPVIEAAHPSLVRLDAINKFFANALSPRPSDRPGDAAALFGAFEQALFGGPHAPDAAVFSGIISAQFALPSGITDARLPSPLDDAPPTTVTTQPSLTLSSSKRRLRSVWSERVEKPPLPPGAPTPAFGTATPPLSVTHPGDAQRLPPPPRAEPIEGAREKEPLVVTREKGSPVVAREDSLVVAREKDPSGAAREKDPAVAAREKDPAVVAGEKDPLGAANDRAAAVAAAEMAVLRAPAAPANSSAANASTPAAATKNTPASRSRVPLMIVAVLVLLAVALAGYLLGRAR